MDIFSQSSVRAFVTKDRSVIREILSPNNAPATIRNQSLAEATVPPGMTTERHYHVRTEEIYYILRGTGIMMIGDEESRSVVPGDAIAIPPGAPHRIHNPTTDDLVFLCCCAPAYTHEDTVLLDDSEPTHPGTM